MLHFDSDYMEGAHPRILNRMAAINLNQYPGYGHDSICESAKKKIRDACGCPLADVWFLVGGTQTNATVIDGVLRRWQGVVAAETGHIAVHEAGAVESSGHKVIPLPAHEGKLAAAELRALLAAFRADANHDHMVEPGMAYISHPTEYGTLYSLAELKELHAVCREYGIPLFLDGARLGYGLAALGEVGLREIAKNTDVFYIGGTKVGALFGEAVVIPRPAQLPMEHFFTIIKQHGALLAKGWLLGVQFDVLFTNELYLEIAKNAVTQAMRIKEALVQKGYTLPIDSPTNQQFVLLEDCAMEALRKKATFGFWEKPDETHTVIRLATSWATRAEDVTALLKLL